MPRLLTALVPLVAFTAVGATAPAARAADRIVFTYTTDAGAATFKNTTGDRWVETGGGGTRFYFREVIRNSDFIEIYDASRKVGVRLYKRKALWRHPDLTDGEWALLCAGEWAD